MENCHPADVEKEAGVFQSSASACVHGPGFIANSAASTLNTMWPVRSCPRRSCRTTRTRSPIYKDKPHSSRGDENLGHDKQRRMIMRRLAEKARFQASPSVVRSVERVEGVVRSLVVSHPRARRDPVQRTQPVPDGPSHRARPRVVRGVRHVRTIDGTTRVDPDESGGEGTFRIWFFIIRRLSPKPCPFVESVVEPTWRIASP